LVAHFEGGTSAEGFENRELRRVIGPKRDEVTGEWSLMTCTPHSYCSDDKIEKNETGGACSVYWGKEMCCNVLVGKPRGKRLLGRPMRR
jgi:hypothetical protein